MSYIPLLETPSATPRGSIVNTQSIDNEDESYPPEYLCPICHHLLRNPVACKSCENTFCKSCLEECFKKNKKRGSVEQVCPLNCPGLFTEKRCPPVLYSLLSKLVVPCANSITRGCPEKAIPYEQLIAHEQACQYQIKPCPTCKVPVALKDMGAHQPECDPSDNFCRACKNKLNKKQLADHTPVECLSRRCEGLESEVTRLKERDTKSQIQIKELEGKLNKIDAVIKVLVPAKQTQAAPFNFNSGQTKARGLFKKMQTVDIPDGGVAYQHFVPPPRSSSRERVGLFGSLGAASQYRGTQ